MPAECLWSHDAAEQASVSLSHFNSLDFVVLHQVCHLMQVGLQLVFFMAQVVQLLAQVGNVGLEHDISVGAGDGLLLQEFPLGLQHFVLLLQEAHLETQESRNLRSQQLLFYCLLLSGFGCRTEVDVEDEIEEKEQSVRSRWAWPRSNYGGVGGDSFCLLMDKGNVWRSTWRRMTDRTST